MREYAFTCVEFIQSWGEGDEWMGQRREETAARKSPKRDENYALVATIVLSA